jgi:uncharacterized protein
MAREIRLFFVTDIHGADRCFIKFVNAGKFYGVDALVLGGDITGKAVVPIYRRAGGAVATATYKGEQQTCATEADLEALRKEIRQYGSYPFVTTEEEFASIAGDPEAEAALFVRLKQEQLEWWVAEADRRLAGTGIECYIMAGNDDPYELDAVLATSRTMIHCDERVVEVGGAFPMLSYGTSTPTPWHSPREIGEEAYAQRLAELAAGIPSFDRAIFNLHVPPYDSGIDICPQIDDQLRVQYTSSGEMMMAPVGSRAVRDAVARYQPLAGLHGHVHEGRGYYRIGRSTGFNPGSDYSEGSLRGVILMLHPERGIRNYHFTLG